MEFAKWLEEQGRVIMQRTYEQKHLPGDVSREIIHLASELISASRHVRRTEVKNG